MKNNQNHLRSKEMPKTQLIEIIKENCGGSLRSKKIRFLRVAPHDHGNSLETLEKTMRSKCGGRRNSLRRRNPPYPPYARARAREGGPRARAESKEVKTMIRATTARIFWSFNPETQRIRDVYVSSTEVPREQYTRDYYSPRWTCVVGNCDADWLTHPEYTPEAVFGEMIMIGFETREELINALGQLSTIDTCVWARLMSARIARESVR